MRIDEDDVAVLYLEPDGPIVSKPEHATDLIGDAWGAKAGIIAVPVSRLDPEFFRLRSLLAGEILQKIVNYRLQLVVLGDIAEYIAASDALRDFVWESNRGEQVWFLADRAALEEKLATRRAS